MFIGRSQPDRLLHVAVSLSGPRAKTAALLVTTSNVPVDVDIADRLVTNRAVGLSPLTTTFSAARPDRLHFAASYCSSRTVSPSKAGEPVLIGGHLIDVRIELAMSVLADRCELSRTPIASPRRHAREFQTVKVVGDLKIGCAAAPGFSVRRCQRRQCYPASIAAETS